MAYSLKAIVCHLRGPPRSSARIVSIQQDSEAITYPFEVSKGAKIRNRYNQVPRLTQDTNGKVTNSQ